MFKIILPIAVLALAGALDARAPAHAGNGAKCTAALGALGTLTDEMGGAQFMGHPSTKTGLVNFLSFLRGMELKKELEANAVSAAKHCKGQVTDSSLKSFVSTSKAFTKTFSLKLGVIAMYTCADGRRIKEFNGACVNATYWEE